MPWFLFAMFWGKVLWDGMKLIFPQNALVVCCLMALAGGVISERVWLPQSFDIAMIVTFYFAVGRLAKENMDAILKRKNVILLLCFAFWVYCCQKGIYIEMSTRSYPGNVICLIESISGTVVICMLSMAIEEKEIVTKPLSWLGRHSLWLFFVHHLDSSLQVVWSADSWYLACVKRLIMDVSVTIVLVYLVEYILRNHTQKERR
jgi:fucose 4-O-acetylase-like acetyltransferase